MKRRRVKITGIGPVTPAGIGREKFWKGILEPVSRVTRLKKMPEEVGSLIGAEVRDFHLHDFVPDASNKRMARHTQMAVASAVLALRDAGLTPSDLRGNSPLIVVGSSLMDFGTINKMIETGAKRGINVPAPPAAVYIASVSSISGMIGELIGGATRTLALQSACCAGVDAIGYAMEMIASGECNFALCGGTESPLYLHPMLELKLAGLIPGGPDNPERQGRPFDLWRMGGAMGEGACVLLLEPDNSPRTSYAYVDGYSFASDPADGLGRGLVDAMRVAIANAGISEESIECINAWGPGHPLIDAAEAAALLEIFGDLLPSIPALSIKGAIGNALGAAGAIQTACAALGMVHAMIPPTVNWAYPDPRCPLNLNSSPRFLPHGTVLVNSHGLSGSNACLVLKR